ncbi:hypothetical protein EDB92DRAFT_1897408, partial [Lactarius akahatsu]
MERLYQMHVIPDVLPGLQPTVDLVLPEALPKDVVLRARAKRKAVPVATSAFFVNERAAHPSSTRPYSPLSRDSTLYFRCTKVRAGTSLMHLGL